MRNVIYSIGVSLDGYIAGPDGDFGWAAPDEELHRLHNEQTAELDAHLVGRRLYETMLPWEAADRDPSEPAVTAEFAQIWQALPKIVFSRTLKSVEGNARLADDDPAQEIARLKAKPGRDIAVGGAGLAATDRARAGRRVPIVRQPGRGRRRDAVLPAAELADRPRAGRDADVRLADRVHALPPRVVAGPVGGLQSSEPLVTPGRQWPRKSCPRGWSPPHS